VLLMGPAGPPVVLLQPLSPTSLALIATLLSVPGEPEAQSGGSEGQLVLAPGSNVATTASTSEVSEAQEEGVAVATPGAVGAVTTALPNQAPRKEGSTGEGEGSGEAEVPPGRKAQPQTAEPPTTVAEFIAGVAESYEQVRLRARLGALWGPPVHPQTAGAGVGQESSPQALATLLARWSPIVVGLGSPALTLAVEFARATLTTTADGHDPDPSDGDHPDRHQAETARPAASSSYSSPIEIEETTAAETVNSPIDLAMVSIGLATVAWTHARRRPQRNRTRVHIKRELSGRG
jgi:hypothetical protein